MISEIVNYIGKVIKDNNKYFNRYDVNCLRDNKGNIIADFNTGKFEEHVGISDIAHVGFYIRNIGRLKYTHEKGFSSCETLISIENEQRLVAYSIGKKQFDTFKIENKLRNNIININFWNYTGKERKPQIKLLNSDLITDRVIQGEYGNKTLFGDEATVISIDFNLIFLSGCESSDCNVFNEIIIE